METLAAQIVTMVILLTVSLALGMVPVLLVGPLQLRMTGGAVSTSSIISVLSCFGGGVFLATCLLDLLPDVRESVDTALSHSGTNTDFPLADFIVAVGLFIILIIEQTALTFKHRHDVDPHARYHGHDGHDDDESKPLLEASGNVSHEAENGLQQADQTRYQYLEAQDDGNRHGITDEPHSHASSLEKSHASHHSGTSHGAQSSQDAHDGDDCHQLHSPSKLRSLLLLGALSLHSVFEGLAIGIQDTANDVWTLSIAVFIHKSILAFSLGVNFVKTGMSKMGMLRSLIVFSAMAPIGITIGIVITAEFSERFQTSLANGSLQGLATGTFLYITFFEVLPHEMSTPQNRLLKVLSIVLGFSVICALILLFSHNSKVVP